MTLKFLSRKIALLAILLACQVIYSNGESANKKTVVLNMIVRNEKDVILRCLASCKPLIDYWVIVDTGSTDGTQDMIREFMKDIPGELHERPWKNFAHNRNEALRLAKDKADYILIIDADETFEYAPGYQFPELDQNLYYIMTHYGGTRYVRSQLIESKINYEWRGVVHEAIYNLEPITRGTLEGIHDYVRTDGARSKDAKKFEKDAIVLEAALLEDPHDSRNVFYLAQSYRDAENPRKAIEAYQRRATMGGFDQEVFWSLFQVARLQGLIEEDPQIVERSYYRAFQDRPTRAEPLYYLAQHYRKYNNFDAAYTISRFAMMLPYTSDTLFVERWVYDWGILLEYSVSSYWLGKYQESVDITNLILEKDLPESTRQTVERNLKYSLDKVAETMTCADGKCF